MDIKHPSRILFLGTRDAGILDIVKGRAASRSPLSQHRSLRAAADLTNSAPNPDETGSIAGLTTEWDAKTAYYSAKIPIWIDEIPDIQSWKTEFLRPEAKEVVDAVGAWIYCFRKGYSDGTEELATDALKAIQEVAEHHAEYGPDAVMLAVAIPAGKHAREAQSSPRLQEEWDDRCLECGFEYIDYTATGKNEYGEKLGFERLKEALEANEWAAGGAEDEDINPDDLDFDVEEDIGWFEREEAEMTAELFGVKAAVTREGDIDSQEDDAIPPLQQEAQVEDLDQLMSKLMAVKEKTADMPKVQRQKMAARAVRDLMKNE